MDFMTTGEQELARETAGLPSHTPLRAVMRRVLDLLEQEEIEGTAHSPMSLADLLGFFSNGPLVKVPKVFLLDNGNFRAVWYGQNSEQLGLQFRGGGIVQWVAFSGNAAAALPKSGREDIAKLVDLVGLLELDETVFA